MHRRYTIGRLMALIAALAFLLASPRLLTPTAVVVAASALGVVGAFALAVFSVEMILGIQCPRSSRFAVHRLARHNSYCRCSACWSRLKRFGYGPWLDAAAPGDAHKYRRDPEG